MTVNIIDTGKIAITTRYVGPTNTRGSRIIATGNGNRVVWTYDHAPTVQGRHAAAAQALCEKMGWTGTLAQGGLQGSGYAFVFIPSAEG